MPPVSRTNANKLRKELSFTPSHFITPQRFRKTERKVFSASDFDDVHRSIAERQYAYIGWPRKNSVRVRGSWIGTLGPSSAYLLGAANIEARIGFAKTAVHEVLRHLDGYEGPVSFFSVCPRQYVLPMSEAHSVNLNALKKLTGQAFGGCSLVGSVDFALFKGFGKRGIRAWHDQVAAHTHGLVWGASEEEMKAMLVAMGADFINVKEECAGYVQKVASDEIAGYMRYALKLPLFECNVTANDDRFDPETGEIFGTTKISTNPLRPGDQLRMAALLHDMSLDHLIFGQLEGTGIAREIRRRARLPLVQKNEESERRNRPPSTRIGIEEISWLNRTPVAKLIQNPPKKVWLGPKSNLDHIKRFLRGHAGSAADTDVALSLPESVFN